MIQSLQHSISGTKKQSIWRQAQLYHAISYVCQQTFAQTFPEFRNDFAELKCFFKELENNLEVKLISTNTVFLTWLQTEIIQLHKILKDDLIAKNLAHTDTTLHIKFQSR